MKAYWGLEAQLHAFLTSALDGGVGSDSRSGRLLGGKNPLYLLDRRGVGSRAGLKAVVKRKKYLPLPGIEPWSN